MGGRDWSGGHSPGMPKCLDAGKSQEDPPWSPCRDCGLASTQVQGPGLQTCEDSFPWSSGIRSVVLCHCSHGKLTPGPNAGATLPQPHSRAPASLGCHTATADMVTPVSSGAGRDERVTQRKWSKSPRTGQLRGISEPARIGQILHFCLKKGLC